MKNYINLLNKSALFYGMKKEDIISMLKDTKSKIYDYIKINTLYLQEK